MIRDDFVKRKISLIQDDLVKLATFSKYTFEEIKADFIKEAAVERILERTINRAIDVNQHLISELATKDTSPPKKAKARILVENNLANLKKFKILSDTFRNLKEHYSETFKSVCFLSNFRTLERLPS